MKKNRGFSLIELMVVIMIVGILAAIAIPAYLSYMRKANRTDAKNALLSMQMKQERYRLNHDTYSNTLGAGSPIRTSTTSDDGHYNLSVSNVTASTYTFTATATGDQANDSACQSFTIDQDGNKSAVDDTGTDTTTECW